MTSAASHTTVDCRDAYALSEFWKAVKNRLHLDLTPRDGTRDAEVERLAGLGARVLADHRDIHGPGTGWVTMADPEGNEFCVLRSDQERRIVLTAAGTPRMALCGSVSWLVARE